jgi:hypothetical protein
LLLQSIFEWPTLRADLPRILPAAATAYFDDY